jgi:acyl-CoA synthetase (NDP forming)
MKPMDAVARLLKPRSVAVVGASADPTKVTGRPIAFLQRHGFAGSIWPVNPRSASVAGLTCYPDVKSLPEAPDAALILLASEHVEAAVGDLAGAGCAAAIVLAGGFGEAGETGQLRQQSLRAAAGKMRLLGPNTIGLVNVTDGIPLSASGALEIGEIPAGGVGLVSQSGGILGSLLSRAAARGIGFSKLVGTGNEADLEVADFIEALVEDDATKVIALYLEVVRRPERFRAAAEAAARRGKPIVAFKVGRSAAGASSAMSHTGALAGADRIYEALFRQTGIIRAERFADLLDIPAALVPGRCLGGRRLAIVTSSGGAATLVADGAGSAGFETPPPDEPTASRLRALELRDAILDRNPIDVTLAGLRPDLFRAAIGALVESPSYDAIVVVVGSSGLTQPDLVASPVIEATATGGKPILVYVSPEAPAIIAHLNRHGVPAFGAPESCATALAAMLRAGPPPRTLAQVASASAQDEMPDLGTGPLDEAESKRLFARFGIPSVREIVAATPKEAEDAARRLGGDVVLKILSRHILHKTEIGGVALDVPVAEVARRCAGMERSARRVAAQSLEGFLVQERIRGGIEMILGVRRDPQLGPALLIGLGGITAELFDDTAIRLPPIARRDAEEMIAELKGAALLTGFRGRKKADVAALADAIVAFSAMVLRLGDRLVEAEINPLFVLPEGEGVRAADGLAVLR